MDVRLPKLIYVLLTVAPLTKAAVPGTFFWKPRVGLDLTVPLRSARKYEKVNKPTRENVEVGMVVLIDGYRAGLTIAALLSYYEDIRECYPHLHPARADYYTNMYRWAWRYFSLIPDWLSNKNSKFVDTHKVWKKRFFYMNYFVPKWMRKILFFVKPGSWEKEERVWKKFVKYAEPNFGKYYRYPGKKFNNYNSMRIKGTVENLDITNASLQ